MSQATDEAEILRETLIAEAEARAGDHPELDLLAAYQEGALEAEAEEGIRDHLVGCRRCAEQLLELRQLMQPEAPRQGVADLEIESAWRRFQAVAAAAGTPARSASPRSWAMTAAASLAVAVLALGMWAARLQETNTELRQELALLSGPVVNLPSFYLGETTRSAGEAAEQVAVPPAVSHFVLMFPVVEVEPAEEYALEFVDEGGEVVLASRGLVMSESGTLQLGLRRGTLPAGTYTIVRKALVKGSWRPVEEYRRAIGYSGGPESVAPAD